MCIFGFSLKNALTLSGTEENNIEMIETFVPKMHDGYFGCMAMDDYGYCHFVVRGLSKQ